MLDKRLALCASMVTGDNVCDIGTDHGYLPCELVSSGKCSRATAADINEKPLGFAEATVKKYELSDKIKIQLSDGLDDLDTEGVTDIVIAGMGGELISDILSRGVEKGKINSRIGLVLQPMTRASVLRRYLCENGFEITEERAVYDGRFGYNVIRAVHNGTVTECDDVKAEYGFMDYSDEAARRYALDRAKRLYDTYKGIMKSGNRAQADEYLALAEKCPVKISEG